MARVLPKAGEVDPGELVEDIERALRDGALPERKAVMQAVVAEVRVRDRGHIQPVFRVPVIGPPYGSVPPARTGRKGRKGRKLSSAFAQVEATYSLDV
jgi:hypothetical protein